MKGRILLYLIALVVIPTAILSIMAGRSVRMREQDLDRRLEIEARRAARVVDDRFQAELKAAQSNVISRAGGFSAEGRLEDLLTESGRLKLRYSFVDLVYVYKTGEGILYPPDRVVDVVSGPDSTGAALLEAADRLQEEGQYTQAVRQYERILSQSEISTATRAEAALGAGRCYRRLGELKLAGGVFRQIAGYSAGLFEKGRQSAEHGMPVQRDRRGFLYDLIALRELSDSYHEALAAESDSGPERWENLAYTTGLELLERLVFLYDRIIPAQQTDIMEHLVRVGIADDMEGHNPGSALAGDEALQSQAARLLTLLRAQEHSAQLKPEERGRLADALQNDEVRNSLRSNTVAWLPVGEDVYSAGNLSDNGDLIAGFRINPTGFRQTIAAIGANVGKEEGVSISLQRWSEKQPAAAEFMTWPFDRVTLHAYPAEPGTLLRNRELMVVLQVWGILMLAAGVIAGAWIVLRQSSDEVRRLRDKSDFIAGVSHDLRTPLASMRMLAESLALERVEQSRRKQFLETIIGESKRLGHMVERVLYFVRFGDDVLTYQLRRTDIGPIVREAVESFSGVVSGRGDGISVEVQQNLPEVMADPVAIGQVVLNLVDNAVKYSTKAGQAIEGVEVKVTANDAGGVDISVHDKGIGIEPGETKKIFRRFYRARNTRLHFAPGTGLGLALCRHIVKGHGGRIEVRSEAGRGSVFTVTLPAGQIYSRCRERSG